ncbi:MAG: 2-oxoacid:acceptor oxidoreductase family protein [Thermoleophilia bacterium]|nr:2-oxoacid:acceptor oxidoreductase family protein [Thermoleophilia bacterium]
MIQIRWHGRGGQGAITAAKIFATAAFQSGYTGVVMAPTFGTERRGAPVFTSLKLAKEKIYDISPIETPDIVVVLDHLLLTEADVTGGLKEGGLVVLNTSKPLEAYDFGGRRLAVADVTSLAVEAGLPRGVVNSGVIGILCRAFDIVPFDLVLAEIETEFKTKRPQANAQAARLAYGKTVLSGAATGTLAADAGVAALAGNPGLTPMGGR